MSLINLTYCALLKHVFATIFWHVLHCRCQLLAGAVVWARGEDFLPDDANNLRRSLETVEHRALAGSGKFSTSVKNDAFTVTDPNGIDVLKLLPDDSGGSKITSFNKKVRFQYDDPPAAPGGFGSQSFFELDFQNSHPIISTSTYELQVNGELEAASLRSTKTVTETIQGCKLNPSQCPGSVNEVRFESNIQIAPNNNFNSYGNITTTATIKSDLLTVNTANIGTAIIDNLVPGSGTVVMDVLNVTEINVDKINYSRRMLRDENEELARRVEQLENELSKATDKLKTIETMVLQIAAKPN